MIAVYQMVEGPLAPWMVAAWVGFALLILDWFDISLPRGDSLGVSGALLAASIVLVGPLHSAVFASGAFVVANLVRYRGLSGPSMRIGLMARFAGFASAAWIPTVVSRTQGVAPPMLAAMTSGAYLMVEFLAVQSQVAHGSGRSVGRLLRGNLVRTGPLLAAQMSTSVLTVLIFPDMSVWGLIPVVALLLIIRQSYALLLDMRETYRTTVEVLVEAAEGQDPRRCGHGERTAFIARAIAMKAGLSPAEVEKVNYAALLHDVDAISDAEDESAGTSERGHSSDVFRNAGFFSDVAPILAVCDGLPGSSESAQASELLAAMIVALASDADALVNPAVGAAHLGPTVSRVAGLVPSALKAKAVAAALELGYSIPAVN